MNIIDGKKIAANLRAEVKEKISKIKGRKPGLAFIQVGDDPSSSIYLKAKKKACHEVGIFSLDVELRANISAEMLINEIEILNKKEIIDGILLQLPLPSHLNANFIIERIAPTKDVDCFHPTNVGKILLAYDRDFLPCTPNGIRYLLEKSGINISGKHVVILGRSNIVGKPLAAILMQKEPSCNATVTVAHTLSENLSEITRSADVLISSMGRAKFITKEMVKPNSVIVDVGINRLNDPKTKKEKIVGDVDFENVAPIVSYITPVPGGVGPMTIAMLLENTLKAYLKNVI